VCRGSWREIWPAEACLVCSNSCGTNQVPLHRLTASHATGTEAAFVPPSKRAECSTQRTLQSAAGPKVYLSTSAIPVVRARSTSSV
jgi:hypothetical protein